MKIGDLVKVKDCCVYGNVYVQQIAGFIGLLIEKEEGGHWMTILTQGKPWRVCYDDLEAI